MLGQMKAGDQLWAHFHDFQTGAHTDMPVSTHTALYLITVDV